MAATNTTNTSLILLTVPKKSRATINKMPPHKLLLLFISTLLAIYTTDASPVFVDNPSLAQFQSGRNIRHLPCIVRKSGRSGVCMFAIDCIKQNGTHLGTCIDRFYFGSCCALKDEASLFAPEINDNSIDQNTISHFAHESTTLPTSTLFKLTTEGSSSSIGGGGGAGGSTGSGGSSTSKFTPQTASELLKNVTQSYLSTVKPIRTTNPTTRRPSSSHTTHKNSHFVVRTTAAAPTAIIHTTAKPPRRRPTTSTTSNRPVLTTSQAVVEQRIETTTAPSKFVTFQIVETTTPSATEPTHLMETTTAPKRHHTKPTHSSRTTTTTTTSTKAIASTTTTSTTTARPTPPLRTTISSSSTVKPHKTQSSRRPAPAKKPITTTTTNTSTSATRRPIESGSGSSTKGNTTAATTTAPPPPPPPLRDEINNNNNKSPTTERATITTHAPRPKPQPTGEIVKVPILLADTIPTSTPATETTNKIKPPTTTTTTTTKPIKSTSPTTTTTINQEAATKRPTIISTTKATTTTTTRTTTTPPTTTTTTTTTSKPTRRHTTKPTTTTTTTTTTTRAPPLLTTTTRATTTTIKPGLITWTDVEGEPTTNASISNDWQPAPPPSNWIPVSNKTNAPPTTTTASSTTVGPLSSSATDKVVISVATSVSTSESKPGAGSSLSTTTTNKPHRTTKPTSTSSTTTTTTTTRATTTNAPVTEFSSSSSSSSVELTSSSTSSSSSGEMSTTTTDYSGEELNTTIDSTGSTTLAPTNTLEGVDYKEVCGRRMFPEPRIVGGANAAFGRWPWQISLRQWRTSTYLHKCGAALLNENWAITAAHCVDNVPPSDLLLRLGEYDLAEEEEPYAYQERRVQIVASHPQFDPRTFEYDLALLRFYEPVVFQPNIIPVCVPENDENFIGQTAFVTGWGRLYEDGPLPSVLQEVAVPVINNTICESMYRTAGYIEHIPHIFICAGWKKGGYDSCEGDSGGPMVLQRESDKRFQLGGVISWGIGCAEANQPGVYTRISEFRDWINQILQF